MDALRAQLIVWRQSFRMVRHGALGRAFFHRRDLSLMGRQRCGAIGPWRAAVALLGVWLGADRLEGFAEPVASLHEDRFVSVIAKVRPSIAAIGSYHSKDKPTAQYVGTGFVVHNGHTVVTNAHVVDALMKRRRLKQMRVFLPHDQPVAGRAARVMAHDRFHDLSVLRFDGPGAEPLELDVERRPHQGQSVGIMGYPIGMKLGLVPAVHRGVIAAVVPAVLPLPQGAKLTRPLAEAIRRPYNLYQLDLVVFPGNSGSPLFDANTGRVFGIINKTLATKTREHLLDQPSGIAYAVPSRWVEQLVTRSDLMSEADRRRELKRLGLLGD